MTVEAQVTICESKAAAWATITDIENAAEIICGTGKVPIGQPKPGWPSAEQG